MGPKSSLSTEPKSSSLEIFQARQNAAIRLWSMAILGLTVSTPQEIVARVTSYRTADQLRGAEGDGETQGGEPSRNEYAPPS